MEFQTTAANVFNGMTLVTCDGSFKVVVSAFMKAKRTMIFTLDNGTTKTVPAYSLVSVAR